MRSYKIRCNTRCLIKLVLGKKMHRQRTYFLCWQLPWSEQSSVVGTQSEHNYHPGKLRFTVLNSYKSIHLIPTPINLLAVPPRTSNRPHCWNEKEWTWNPQIKLASLGCYFIITPWGIYLGVDSAIGWNCECSLGLESSNNFRLYWKTFIMALKNNSINCSVTWN